MESPKLFISYSWSSPDHEAWVITFAEELTSQGIHVILDKWDLKPGHDANAFMESMVSDPAVTKVILVCDQKYAEKSNKRAGGAGTEAQIITPELYAKKAQDKFVAVLKERDADGKACLPAYYGGRIYFDLCDPSTYATEFEKIVRWAWDKPVYARPELGSRPAFLSEGATQIKVTTSISYRRALDALKVGKENAVPIVREYFDAVVAEMESFRVVPNNSSEFDDLVVESIANFLPYRNELIEVFVAIAAYRCTDEMLEVLHRLFERLLPFLSRPESMMQWSEDWFDNYGFTVHELFLYCHGAMLQYDRFAAINFLTGSEYYFDDQSVGSQMHSYVGFRKYLSTLAHRTQRLSLRVLSLRAQLLKERNHGAGVDFKHLMAADFILYLRSIGNGGRQWWPETLVFISWRGITFEIFARAKSLRYFDRIKVALDVKNKADLEDLLQKIESKPDSIPAWQFDKLDPRRLVLFEAIATTA